MPLLALVLTCLPTLAAPQLQPRTYASPSGRWGLRVEPTTRSGTGEADYTLTGAGTAAWTWRVAESTEEPVELPEFPGRAVDRVVELADGRLLVLSQQVYVYTRTGARIDSAPWHTERDPEDPPVSSTEDIAVTSTSEVVTLDVVRKAQRVFSAAGRHLRTIDLAEAWGAQPRYPTVLVADRSGGVLVHDYRGKDALVRMGLDGTVLARLDARMTDGQPRAEYRRNVQFAPDGRMWKESSASGSPLPATSCGCWRRSAGG